MTDEERETIARAVCLLAGITREELDELGGIG